MNFLRNCRRPIGSFLCVLTAVWQISQPLQGADFYWDTDASTVGNDAASGVGLGGTGTWDTTSSNWWDLASLTTWPNTSADQAIFSGAYAPSSIPTLNTVTLSGAITANKISFLRSGYTLTGGTSLTLAGVSAGFHSLLGESATIDSIIGGSDGLVKTGGGSIRLGNSANTYTGTTAINNGTLIISNGGALGLDGSAVVITTGNTTPSNVNQVGFTGGSLVLDGTSSGFSFSRDVDLEGRGPIGDRGAAIQSLGNNTLSGTINAGVSPQVPATFRNSRINSVNGTLALSGTTVTNGTSGSAFLTLGGINSAGVGHFDLNGVLSGTGSIEKSGAGTLFLNPLSTSGFSGTLRISGASTGQQSSVRVTQLTVGGTSIFGTNVVSGDNNSAIDINGGVLEFRFDGDLNFGSLATGKNVHLNDSSTFYSGPAVGGSAVNGLTTLGTFRVDTAETATFNSRNGFGFTFGAWTQESSNGDSVSTNNMGGTLTYVGNAWNNSDGSNRLLTVGGNGNTVITGSINTSGAGIKTLTKTGSGNLTIIGTATSLNGPVNVQGALTMTDFRSIGAASNVSSITLGNTTTTSGSLVFGTSTTPSAAGLTTSRPIILNGTTAGNSIYANQSGANPVILNGAITKPIAGNATLNLGGSSTADNIINVGIPALGTGGILKVGSGTWVLAAPNSYTGATNIVNGTLKLQANAAVSTILAATNDITFGNSNVFSGGTFEFVGQDGVNNVQTLDVLTTSSGANTVRLTPGIGGTASLTFASQSTGGAGTVNFVGADFVNNKITITGGNGLISRTNYWEGADFAYRDSNVLRAPVYGTDAGFVSSSTDLTATANMEITGSFATDTVSISTLKIMGSQTLTLNAAQTVTLSAGGILVTGGNAIITGGAALALGTQALVVRTNLGGDSLDIQSVITGSGGLTKSGAGTLILSGVNAQTGTVTINEGTVQLSGSGTLGAPAALTLRQGALLDLNGVTPATNTIAFNNNGEVTSATAATFTVGGSNGTGDSRGIVSGAISLTKLGTGNQNWLGASTYTGVTTIGSTGLVTVDTLADGGLPSGIGASTNIASNLVFNGSTGGLSYAGVIRDNNITLGSRSATTDRLFTLAGTGARMSSTVSNNNAIVWSNIGAIVHGVVGPQLLNFDGTSTGDNTFNPQITDSGTVADITSVTKTGTGQWNLGNANNTYTGVTTVSNGILALNNNGALPANSPLALGTTTTNGILQMSGNFERNLVVTPAAGTGTISWTGTTGGGGFAAHTTQLVVAMGGIATPTALNWGSGGFVGSGGTQSLIFNSASSLAAVEFRNAIDLGAAVRTMTVNDNANTGADYATITGILSGAGGGLLKNGSGILRLTGANIYTGTTEVQAGTLVLRSLGNSADVLNTPTSVGVSGVAFDNTNAIVLGNASTTGGILQYVGAGETSDRKIRLRGTTAGNQIHADGSGPLILTNVAHDTTETGNKTLSLRGTNMDGNMITSQLSNNVAGVLSIGVDGGATWILTNSANNYTGTTSVNAGALGIGHDTAIGAALSISNGNVFAYGGDRILTNTLNMGNNATSGFIGDYSITFNGANNLAAGASNLNTYNSIVAGEALILNGLLANSLTATRAWTLDGQGETVVNGDFTTSTAFGLNITKNGNGTLTLGTNGATSNWNQAGNNLDLDRGTLKFTTSNAIPSATNANGGLTISPEIATTDTAMVNLNGTTQTINALTATSDGAVIIDNTSSSAAAFRFGANDTTVNFGSGIGSYTIQNTGAGALSLFKLGNTSATFISGMTLAHKGITASEGGGVFTIASPVTATTGLRAIETSTLALTGGLPNGNLVTSVEVGGGSTLSLLDGVGSQLSNLTSLSLGNTGVGTVTLNLNIGDLSTPGDNANTDLLNLLTGGTLNLGNTITFNMTDVGLNPLQTYTLLNVVDGGLSGLGLLNFIQGATPGGFSGFTWNVTDNLVQITTGTLITGKSWWNANGTLDSWNDVANWSVDENPPTLLGGKAGTFAAISTPGQGTDVIFIADNIVGGAPITTTLEQNFKINSLTFEASTTPADTPSSVTINPGVVATNRLEIAPQLSADGITITASGPASVIISAPLKVGADQTWNIADAATTLTISGSLQGEADVTKSGSGKVLLSAAADPTFNGGQTAIVTVAGGDLEFTNSGALGTSANSNVPSIVISGGGFYYNNATAGTALTLPHNITLSGGALSGGGANHTYGGSVNVSAASTINMADSNTALTGAARSITLSGIVSGSGNLIIDSNNTASAGNQIGGTLTISNAASNWNGNLFFNRGTVTIATAASPTVTPGNVTFNSFGRLIFQGVDGQTINRSGILDLVAGSVGELSVDNTTTGQVTDFTVNQNGLVTLGSGGIGATLRIALSDTLAKLNLTGGVTLGGNSSISLSNNAARILTISSVISDGGNGYSLAINDDAGAWGQTNGTVRLLTLNTFSGDFTLGEGILEFDTVTNAAGAASSLGQGNAIAMGASNLNFVGSASQSTNRPITTTGSAILSANGSSGAVITYNGAITQAANNALSLGGSGEGVITGGITQPVGSGDMIVSSGTWTIKDNDANASDDLLVNGGTLTLQNMVMSVNDDIVVTAGTLNLNSTGVWAAISPAGTSSFLFARGGAVINLNANDVNGVANANLVEGILLGDGTTTGTGTMNMNGFNLSIPRFDLGAIALNFTGDLAGPGTLALTGTATDYSVGLRAFRGSISANLAGVGSVLKQGLGDVTLSGDNSGLTGTVAATRLDSGNLILDFSTQNNNKLSAVAALDMRGGTLTLNGNNAAASSQSVSSFTLGNGGAGRIVLNPGVGQEVALNLGAITRAVNSLDGTLRVILPAGVQSATNGITTTTGLTAGLVGAAAYLTVEEGTGTWFATKDGNNIVALLSTPKNDVSTWVAGDHITDETTGIFGAYSNTSINSLRFDASGGSDLSLGSTGVFGITTGGVLITSNVGGTPSITNGTIFSGALASNVPELIITHDGSSTFELGSALRVNSALTKSGMGTLLLSGNNVYSGSTDLQNGILQLIGGNAIGDNSLVNLSADKATTLQLLADETIGRLQGGSATTGLNDLATFDLGGFTLTLNQSSSTTYAGVFTGTGSLVMNAGSAGNFTLTNSSPGFTGEVIINGGLFLIGGDIARLDASSFTVNKNGNLLLDNNGNSSITTRILDTASIILNSADGPFSGETRPRGLSNRENDNVSSNETYGSLVLNSGASYVTLEASGGTSAQGGLVASIGWTRNNAATINVRGRNLGGTANERAQFKVANANDAAMLAANIGGGGTIGGTAKNVSIIPWAIGENLTEGLGDGNMGNTFLSYVDDRGFVPLNLTNEFATFTTATSGDNIRESLSGDLTGVVGASINSLIINNINTATVNATGSGVGHSLANNSGAFLFTLSSGVNSTAYNTILGGFDDGITTSSSEYVFYVVNPSSATTTPTLTATVGSPLNSTADIIKSGRGTLIFTAANTAGGGASKTTINEGILEIADLDNIGGNTGALVFSGGTLRLGSTLTDDISLRTITLLIGGGTIDTNGVDLALTNTVGSGLGGFSKTGLGNLTLNAAATYTGATVVSGGTLTVGANNATGNGGNLTVNAGATLDLGASSINHNLVNTSGASPLITGTGTITATSGFFFNHTGDTTIDALLAGSGGVLKAQANEVVLSGPSTYTGTTEIQAGTLSINSIANVGAGASALGAPTTAEAGIIRMGLSTAATTLTYTGSGHSTDRIIGMQGTTGGVTLNGSGTGAIDYAGVRFEMAGNKSLTLGGTSDVALINSVGTLTEVGGVLSLIKTDTNTWSLNQSNAYTGATSINNGILRLSAVQDLTGALQFGSTTSITTAGSLVVQESATFGSMLVQTNSAVNTNNLSIDATKSVTINGNVTLGSSAATTNTLFAASGDGSFIVSNAAASGVTFLVGNSNTNISTADFSALGSMNVSLNPTAGILQVSSTSTTNSTGFGTLILAKDTTITASALTVGGGGSYNNNVGQVNSLKLGTTSNMINADTINIGTGLRDFGSVTFQDTTGTLVVRAADGTGRAAFNMGTTGGATGVATAAGAQNTFDVTGHNADLLLGAVAIGTQATRGDVLTNIFSFDTGTLDMTSLTMSVKTGTGLTGLKTVNSTVNLGGGTVVIGTINQMGQTSTAGNIANATLNVTGGIVTIGTGSGTAITMASANTGTTANGAINLTGGATTVTGSIVSTGGAGTTSAVVTLNGGTLNMSGNSIGTGVQNIAFAAQSGALSGLAELNGGGVLDKTTAGILSLGNGNAYTGGTTVSAGTLLASNTTGSATGSGSVSTLASTVLGGTGIIAPGSGNAVTVNGTLQVGGTSPVAGQTLNIATNAAALTINNLLTFDLFSGEGSGPGPVNGLSTADRLLLTGNTSGASVVLGASSIFEITTAVSSGWAAGSSWQLIDWAGLTRTGTFSNLTSTVGNFANLPDISNLGLGWDVSAIYSTGVVSIAVIPEPSRAMLLLLGLLGLFLRRRRN